MWLFISVYSGDRKATLSKCVKKVNKNVIKLMNQKIIK